MPLKRIAYNIFFNSCDGGLVLDYKILFFKSCNASNSREGDLCKIQDSPLQINTSYTKKILVVREWSKRACKHGQS